MKQVIAMFSCWNATPDAATQKCWNGNDAENKPMYTDVTGLAVQLGAVPYKPDETADSENNAFALSTPSGQLSMRVMNDNIREADFFEPGAQYKLTIEKVKDAPKLT